MANIALLRKASGDVVWIGGAVIVLQVAAHARGCRQIVLSALVAISALQLQVRARQWEAALGMIEGGRLPGGGAVADRAICGEPAGDVIRIAGSFVIRHVAGCTGRTRQIKVPVGMTIGALQLGVRAR